MNRMDAKTDGPLVIGVRCAIDGLRMYWRGATVVAATGVVALGAMLLIASVFGVPGGMLDPRFDLSTVRGGYLGLDWTAMLTVTPATIQREALSTLFGILVAVAIGVTLVATVTVFTVSVARATQRSVEIGVRRAVGASRRGLLHTALVEGGFVTGIVTIAGALIGGLLGSAAAASWPGNAAPWRPWTALIAIGVISGPIVLGALFTLAPHRGRAVRETSGKSPVLHATALQLGLSLIVLSMSALIMSHVTDSTGERTIIGNGNGVVLHLDADGTPAARAGRYTRLLRSFDDSMQYGLASLSSPGALVGLGLVSAITTECGECSVAGMLIRWHVTRATYQFVSADTFGAIGARLVAGRLLTSADRWGSAPVVVVNHALAERHFQQGDAVGRRLKLGSSFEWYTVVGVVDDPPRPGFGVTREPPYTVYLSILQFPAATADLLLRPRTGTAITAGDGQRRAVALGFPPTRLAPMRESGLIAAEAAPLLWFVRWIGVEGRAMLLIAIAGVFALMRFWVGSLRPEIGVRRAVGARQRSILLLILSRASVAGVCGVAFALWFTPAAHDALAIAIQDLPAWEPASFFRYALLLVGIALAGAAFPAWRASRTAPATLVASADG